VLVEHSYHEHEAPRNQLAGHECPPSGPQELVSLARTHTPSLGLKPIRLKSLLRVDSLTDAPTTRSTKRQLSLSVTPGLVSTAASSSLLVFSSSLGLEPGCFFGVSGSPPGLPRRNALHR